MLVRSKIGIDIRNMYAWRKRLRNYGRILDWNMQIIVILIDHKSQELAVVKVSKKKLQHYWFSKVLSGALYSCRK